MDNLYIEEQYFFVPYRLLWTNWEKFNGAQDDPGDSIEFTVPQIEFVQGVNPGGVGDHFGLPTSDEVGASTLSVSAFHFRAYKKIWNEWYRAQDLQDSLPVDLDDGPDLEAGSDTLLKRGKRHDYVTSWFL